MKYILVTGANGGMGRKTVEYLENQGFGIFALDKEMPSSEKNVISLQADITDAESVKAAFDKVKDHTDELYAIIHFAGIYMLDSLAEISVNDFKHAFEVNLFGAFCINRAFLPLMKNGSHVIITTSELATLDPLPFTGIYAVTKGALDKYAYSLCMELQLLGISVSVLRAGAVNTGMLGTSTNALDAFCGKTRLYSCNAARFKKIVDSVESKCVKPELIARKASKILNTRKPKFAYSINRNPLLILLNALPKKLQLWIIQRILK